ncbi:MAG: serine--tRNA ligase, partial [Clostridia bacterium]|nr:serine--tRNA ligase [Clostridia bacterium]
MLDIKRIRMDGESVVVALKKRHGNFPIDQVIELDEERRRLLVQVEEMKAEQNRVSKEIPTLKKEGKDVAPIFEEMKILSEKVKELDVRVKEIDEQLKNLLLQIPNTPHESVVEGKSDEDNIEMRK